MKMNRRQFLEVAGSTSLVFASYGFLGGCEKTLEKIRNRPIRRSITTLADNDPIVVAYRDGVSQMKALPSTDRRNWTRQAEIHDDFCPHGNWYFLPWHRAYLVYFETIIRELSGNADFALPYWNWTCSPSIPEHFFGAGNTLADNTRTKTQSDVIPETSTGETVLSDILDIPDFETFGSSESTALRGGVGGGYGELEGTPHNLVHGWIGGNMGGFMSPLDPVFWCHHNMVERCWWEWNITRGNANPNDSNWYDLSLGGMFCDKDGNLINNITVATTALMPLLSYQYDDQLLPCASRIAGFTAIPRDKSKEELREFLSKGGPFRLKTIDRFPSKTLERIEISGARVKKVQLEPAVSKSINLEHKTNKRFILTVSGAVRVTDNDVFVRVFINAPQNQNLKSRDNIYYAGSFAFFGEGEHAEHADGNTYHIDITDTVKRLAEQGIIKSQENLSFSFTAVSMSDEKVLPKGGVRISSLEMTVNEDRPR